MDGTGMNALNLLLYCVNLNVHILDVWLNCAMDKLATRPRAQRKDTTTVATTVMVEVL